MVVPDAGNVWQFIQADVALRRRMPRHTLDRSMNRRYFMAVLAGTWAVASPAADAIPAHLVGVWATKNSVMRGAALFEGMALYLGADGRGGIVGGPPPIGVQIIAAFNHATNQLTVEMIDSGKPVQRGSFDYDPATQSIIANGPQKQSLYRRFNELSPETRRFLGL
jgi:hypothetical protein